jgi:peptidyl-prolyl cis-trans isomerase SurA
MQKLLLFLFFLFTSGTALQAQDKAIIDRVIASIGTEHILLSEVQEQYAYAKSQQKDLPEEYLCVILQNMIVQKMLVNQAKIDSVKVTDDEVDTQLTARIERLLSYFNQDPKALEEYYGQTIDQIKETTRNDLRNQLLAERLQGQITDKATITPSEVKAFYQKIPKDSLPYFNAEVEIREIVYKPKVNPEEKAKARQKIDDLRKRIVEDGEDFANMAKKYSDDTGSAAAPTGGGDLGWQKRGTFVSEFEAMVYNLEKNQISPVVETEFGFHIIQLLERRGNLVRARHILVKPEVTETDLDKAETTLDSVRADIQSKKLTFSEAVKLYGDKNTQSYNNDGIVSNPRTGNSFFEVADLDTDVFFSIDGLAPGQIGKPVAFTAPDGTQMFKIVQLQSRSKPHKADLKKDYNKIQKAALEQKKGTFTEKWVLDKLRTTYLSIVDPYNACPNLQEMLKAQEN